MTYPAASPRKPASPPAARLEPDAIGIAQDTVIGMASAAPSGPEMITSLSGDIPADIRSAVEAGLQGWHRLRRFQAAMTFPAIEAAATHIGAHQSALIHQFRRLERDIGAQLYHPSTPRQPMRPTPRGAALLAALARPDIHAAATATAADVSGSRPRKPLRASRRRPARKRGTGPGNAKPTGISARPTGSAACSTNSANPSSQTSTPERQPR